MKPEIEEFKAGLDAKLDEVRFTVPAIDQLGYALDEETRRLYQAANAIERRDAAARHLLATMAEAFPTAAREAKRDFLADQITAELPKMFEPRTSSNASSAQPMSEPFNFRNRMASAAAN